MIYESAMLCVCGDNKQETVASSLAHLTPHTLSLSLSHTHTHTHTHSQDAFYESYFERDRETIFRSVELLIYVFDIESDSPEKDFDHFCGVLEALEENSPDARIFVLVHKMDLVARHDRAAILQERQALIQESCVACGVQHFECFGTSIWDETLYKAWSEIVTNLIPNLSLLETHLHNFCRICDAEEVVLFERATFLVIAHAQQQQQEEEGDGVDAEDTIQASSKRDDDDAETANTDQTTDAATLVERGHDHDIRPRHLHHRSTATTTTTTTTSTQHFDAHRFEKISNIVKQFKLSCGKAQSPFQGMEVRNSRFAAYLDHFTANTVVMVIVAAKNNNPAVTTVLLNIQNARNLFEKFIPRI